VSRFGGNLLVSADVETLTVNNISTQLSGAKSDETPVFNQQ